MYKCPLCGDELAFSLSVGNTGMVCNCGFRFVPMDCQGGGVDYDMAYRALQKVVAANSTSPNIRMESATQICSHYLEERIPTNEEETHFEKVSCCMVSGKLHHA